jgi:Rieske Fe-S protein
MLKEMRPRRRTVIVGAGLGALATAVAACSTYGKTPAGSETASSAPAGSGASGTPGSGPLAKTAAVPVGSGLIVGDVVITQPTAGVFKGFSTVCPHAGCHVSAVTDGKIVCPCHGSKFNLDGSVDHGPAKKPLEAEPVSVQGDSIVAG